MIDLQLAGYSFSSLFIGISFAIQFAKPEIQTTLSFSSLFIGISFAIWSESIYNSIRNSFSSLFIGISFAMSQDDERIKEYQALSVPFSSGSALRSVCSIALYAV